MRYSALGLKSAPTGEEGSAEMGEEEHVENRGLQEQTVHRLTWPHGPRSYQLTVPATRRLHVLVPCGVRIVVKDAKEKRIGCWERSWAAHRLERERVERGESDGIVCESSLRRKQSGDERSCSRNATHGAGDDRRAHWTGAVTSNNASESGREELARTRRSDGL